MPVLNPDHLQAIVARYAGQVTVEGLTAAEHLKASWCESAVYAGDSLTIEMLRSQEYDSYRMYSWLAYYRVFKDQYAYGDKRLILARIAEHRAEWIASPAAPAAFVGQVYRTLIDDGVFSCFSLSTKVSWLLKPTMIAIYDSKAIAALTMLSNLGCVSAIRGCPSNSANGRTAARTQAVVDYYAAFYPLVAEIADVCADQLDDCLQQLPALFAADHMAVPGDLAGNRMRMLDKVLWMMGSPADAAED
ncbi:hypothetical protein [Dongia sp.]|uniref:hypothetical protein n=1 Tax=Dongia sp. TaxID=1977262 RepID=UPI0035B43F78